jgi:hypothetical protein
MTLMHNIARFLALVIIFASLAAFADEPRVRLVPVEEQTCGPESQQRTVIGNDHRYAATVALSELPPLPAALTLTMDRATVQAMLAALTEAEQRGTGDILLVTLPTTTARNTYVSLSLALVPSVTLTAQRE